MKILQWIRTNHQQALKSGHPSNEEINVIVWFNNINKNFAMAIFTLIVVT